MVINELHNIQLRMYIQNRCILGHSKVFHHIFVHVVPLYSDNIGVNSILKWLIKNVVWVILTVC